MRGKIIGSTYVTRRKPNHFMRKFQGFGISRNILLSLNKKGIKWVNFEYEGEKGIINYIVSLEKYLISDKTHIYQGRLSQNKEDLQIFVSIKDMLMLRAQTQK